MKEYLIVVIMGIFFIAQLSGGSIAASVDDQDGDGLSDDREIKLGTNPTKSDTDGDGLNDLREIWWACDPNNEDTKW